MGKYFFLLTDMRLIMSAMTQCLCPRDFMGAEEKRHKSEGVSLRLPFPQFAFIFTDGWEFSY